MFLEALAQRNPGLVRAAVSLHQSGEAPTDCFVFDTDAIRRNAPDQAGRGCSRPAHLSDGGAGEPRVASIYDAASRGAEP